MIPDKIYFGYDEGVHLESYCLEKKGKCQLEYVRKDALLEWAKGFTEPKIFVSTLIDKLNQL